MAAQWTTTETRASVTFPSPTRTSYTFKRWNTDPNDTGTGYNGGSTLTPTGNMTVYAIWNPIISFNANGGSGAPSNQTKTFNSELTLSTVQPTRTGYTFSKWNTAANGTGTDYNPGGTVAASMNTAMTLYAQWTANTYTVSFNANGGTNAPSSISKTYGQSVTLPTDKPTRIGHTFLGWALSSSAETAQWLAGSNFSEAITANTTLYAVWRDDYESPSITTLRAYRCGFEPTQDTAIDPDKTYYERSGSGTSEDPYIYTEVEEPDVSDLPTYYELIDDDEAGYARVEATWSIDTSVDEGVVNSATMTGTITPEGQPAQAITFQSGYQGTSGNAVALVDGLDVDTQYTVTVTVTDIKGASMATSRTVLLLRAFYIFDFGSQGNAVGIGRAAPQSGMEVGYPATFDDTVNLYDELQFNGEQAYPTFSRSSWSTSSDQTTLPVTPCFVHDTTSGVTYWCDGITITSLGYLPLSGGTLTGAEDIKSSNLVDGTAAAAEGLRRGWQDKNGVNLGRINPWFFANGDQTMRYLTHRKVGSSDYYHGLAIGMDSTGNPMIRLDSTSGSAAAAWRNAMGTLAADYTDMAGSNLNNQQPGECWWGNAFTNGPRSSGYHQVFRIGMYQIAFAFTTTATSPNMYLRSYVNNTWQPWVRVDADGSLPLSGGTATGNIEVDRSSGDTGFIAKRTDQNVSIGLLVGGTGTNHGIWSYKLNKWLIYGDASNVYVNGMKMATDTVTTASSIITAASGITINSAKYSSWGKLAMFYISFKSSSAISVPANGNITDLRVGTLVSGKRPAISYAWVISEDNATGYIDVDGNITLSEFEATGSARTVAANTNIYLHATYILA